MRNASLYQSDSEVFGWIRALTESHIPFDEIRLPELNDLGQLEGKEFVVLGDIKFLSDLQAKLLDDFAANGGTIIATGETGLYNNPDAGFDSIHDQGGVAAPLNAFLDALDQVDSLPKTILYNLNPIYNNLIGSTIANFQTEAGIKGKIQLGSGWWFNDTKLGMERQLSALADHGLLIHFVGMLTDSRSFISFPRHEYFRRVLCNLVGTWVEDGEVPNDPALLKKLIENICYNNAREYFNISVE